MALLNNYTTEQDITLEDGSILTISTQNIVEKVIDKIIKNHAIESIRREFALYLRHISGATARAQQKRRDDQISKTGESKVEPAWPNEEEKAIWQSILDTMSIDEKDKQWAKFTFDLEKHHEEKTVTAKKARGRAPVTLEEAMQTLKAEFLALKPHGTEQEYLMWAVVKMSDRPASDIDLTVAEVPEGETTSGEAIAA